MPKKKTFLENKNFNFISLKALLFVIVIVWFLQIVVSNQLATAGSNLREVEDRIQVTESRIEKLNLEITEKSSLDYLLSKAEKMELYISPKLVKLQVSDDKNKTEEI